MISLFAFYTRSTFPSYKLYSLLKINIQTIQYCNSSGKMD